MPKGIFPQTHVYSMFEEASTSGELENQGAGSNPV